MGKEKKQRDVPLASLDEIFRAFAIGNFGEEYANEMAKQDGFEAAREGVAQGPIRSRDELIRIHENAILAHKKVLKPRRQHTSITVPHTFSTICKSSSPSTATKCMDSLLPIAVRDLTLGITHLGRSLTGRVLGDVFTMTSVMGLLEDTAGEVVRFAVYGHLDNIPSCKANRVATELYPPGRLICICEPYYKLAADNIAAVRVDNPMEVLFLDDHPSNSSSRTAASLKEQADACYRESRFDQALHGYECALSAVEPSGVTALVMQNLAAANLRMDNPRPALVVAAAAMACLKSVFSVKACYRAATAAIQLDKPVAARWALEQAPQADGAMGKDVHDLKTLLLHHKKDAAAHGHIEFATAVVSAQVEALFLPLKPTKSPASDILSAKKASGRQAERDRHEAVSEETSPEALKAKGNVYFQAGDLEGAVEQWCCALRATDPMMPTLLCNQAQVAFQLENFASAALFASAAVVLAPESEKAHFRRAKALHLAQQPLAAQKACCASLSVLPNSTNLKALMKQCTKAWRGDAAVAWNGLEPAKGRHDLEESPFFAEKLFTDALDGHIAASSSCAPLVYKMNTMEILHPDVFVDAGIGPPVPLFNEHYLAKYGVPPACDAQKCASKLSNAYQVACVWRMVPHLMKKSQNPAYAKTLLDSENAATFLTLSRGGAHVEEMISAKDGDVKFSLRAAKYHEAHAKLLAFCNPPNFPLPFRQNTTHVAVGFVDFGDLAETVRLWQEEGRSNPKGSEGSLHWVGIDSSAYVCDFAAVELEMLKQDCPEDHVLRFKSLRPACTVVIPLRHAHSPLLMAIYIGMHANLLSCEAQIVNQKIWLFTHQNTYPLARIFYKEACPSNGPLRWPNKHLSSGLDVALDQGLDAFCSILSLR
jgi:tetratricopeptide (TPR) repeat protein